VAKNLKFKNKKMYNLKVFYDLIFEKEIFYDITAPEFHKLNVFHYRLRVEL
jgi:hypothetical protein